MTTRQSSPSSEPIPKRIKKLGGSEQKVCIALRPSGVSAEIHYIYIVDLNQKDIHTCSSSPTLPRRNASIKFTGDYPFGMGFIAVDFTLYMFGGKKYLDWEKESYSYDLSSFIGDGEPCFVLDFDSMKDDNNTPINSIPSMTFQKIDPRAVLIGARICVFSLYLEPPHKNFEMYDPANRTWLSIPEPPILDYSCEERPLEVTCFCVENLSLLISTHHGSYSIDFGQPWDELKWVPYYLPTLLRHSPQPVLKVGNLLYSPDFVYDVNYTINRVKPSSYPPMFPSLYAGDRAITCLPKQEDERLRVCIVETGGSNRARYDLVEDPVVRVSVLKFDADPLSSTIVNSRMFLVDSDIMTYVIDILGVFPMYSTDDGEDQS